MGIYGIGAMYGGKNDKMNHFFQNECACIGWDEQEAPALHSMLRKVKVGDFIYIKSMSISTQELRIKAIGILIEDKIKDYGSLGEGLPVKWLWEGDERV